MKALEMENTRLKKLVADQALDIATDLRERLWRLEVGTLYIEPGSPWENG